jgi:hypothetical protein
LWARGLYPALTLVGKERRLPIYRHAMPTRERLGQRARPERPTLLDARITLRRNAIVLDQVTSYTAMRSEAISRDRFMLNGRPYHLRLVLDQGSGTTA